MKKQIPATSNQQPGLPPALLRGGITAAERADLKGSAEMPPLRQAATTFAASSEMRRRESTSSKNGVQSESVRTTS